MQMQMWTMTVGLETSGMEGAREASSGGVVITKRRVVSAIE